MSTISVSLPSDGTGADVSDYNTPITTIVNAINGGLDSNNISSLSGTKITASTLPSTALDAATLQGWNSTTSVPNTVTYNGNHSYTCVFNSVNLSTVLSAGMRLRTTRTVAAPTQCTSLNGSTQYYSKTSPNKLTFTDDFVVSASVKLTSYSASGAMIISRFNGTSGWALFVDANGAVTLKGYNAGVGNSSSVASYQSIPLNKWVHIAAQLDMSAFTATTTTSYVMIDAVDVPAAVSRAGTNPTSLVQAGNLEVGSYNSGTLPFPGKIAQAAVFNAKVTQSTMQGYISQGLAGTETSLASAYSFNNAITDLNTTTPNDLTANGSAVATNADSPFGYQAGGTISSTLDYGIVQSVTFSTNTTVVVQVPEGCTIPTSGGVASVAYSSNKMPFGFPGQRGKWEILSIFKITSSVAATANTWYNLNRQLTSPIGEWEASLTATLIAAISNYIAVRATLSTTNNSETETKRTALTGNYITNQLGATSVYRSAPLTCSSSTIYYLNILATSACTIYNAATDGEECIRLENAYL